MASWWERFPGRLEAEVEDFQARDLEFELDDALFRDAGRVLLRGAIDYSGRAIDLEVLYPDLFPYLRPEVYAPRLSLERHQNPTLRNLCLLDRATRAWRPEETGAWLVVERVPHLLSLLESEPEVMAAAEVPQGEPISAYFPGIAGTTVFVPAIALALDRDLRAGSGRLAFSAETPPGFGVRALLSELVVRRGRKTRPVGQADDALMRRFAGERIQIRWVRLAAPPSGFSAGAIFADAEEVQAGFGRPPWQSATAGEIAVTGVVFPEEVAQGEIEDAWLFAIRWRRTAGGQQHEGDYVIRGERLTSDDLGARIPKLARLRQAVVAQVGLGALGGPLSLEFARNQVGILRLLEHDHVETAQTVRWPFGLEAVGHPKLETLARFIEQHYPYTSLERFPHRLGQTAFERHGRTENELDLVGRFLENASLVVDASAEVGVQQLVSDFAREQGLAQIFLTATEGARGGQVALIVPGQGGCWYCWKRHALEQTIPVPPFDGDATVQPRGCAARTFTGASFDLLPITAHAARVAAGALASEESPSSTVWICAQPEYGIGAPTWTEHDIGVHPECPLCAPAS